MKRRLFPLVLVLALGGSMAISGTAFAGPATDVVKAKQTQLFEKIKASDDAAVLSLLDEMVDYDAIAKASLGDQWGTLSDSQKSDFTSVLTKLVQQAYKKNLNKIIGFAVSYVSEDASGDVTKVKTTAKKPDSSDDPIEITFSMRSEGSSYKVVDIDTEGVSLVSSYRSQFVKVIKKDGFATLLQKMKDKLAS